MRGITVTWGELHNAVDGRAVPGSCVGAKDALSGEVGVREIAAIRQAVHLPIRRERGEMRCRGQNVLGLLKCAARIAIFILERI